jgi:hypothetical protein
MMRTPVAARDNAEQFPGDWEDSIVVGSIVRNRDGTITVSCQIDVIGDDEAWVTYRDLRLEKRD